MTNKIRHLFQHQGFRKYFANTSWLFAEKILRMGVGLFVGIWVARYLGPSKYGLLSYAQSFVGLFSAIATLGLDGIVVRELVKYPEKEKELLGTAFILKLFGAILTLIILYIAIHFTSNDQYTNTLIFIIASAVIFQSFNVIDMYFQAKVMSKYVVFANSFSLLLSSFVKIILIINDAPLIAFAWVVLFDSIVLAMGYLYVYYLQKKEFFIRRIKFSIELVKSLLKDSWPLIIGLFGVSIYSRIDQIMLQETLNSKAVGYYSVAVKLTEMWFFVTMVLTNTFFTAITSARKQDINLFVDRIENLYSLLTKIAIVIIVMEILFSKFIIIKLFGLNYLHSNCILKIYIWSLIFVFLSNGSWSYFLNEKLEKLAGLRLVYGGISNIILNYFLIKKYGTIGAAYATVISFAIASYFFNLFHIKTRKNFILQTKALLNIFNLKSWVDLFTLRRIK